MAACGTWIISTVTSFSLGSTQKYVPVIPAHEKSPTDPGTGFRPGSVRTAKPRPKLVPNSGVGPKAPKPIETAECRSVEGGIWSERHQRDGLGGENAHAVEFPTVEHHLAEECSRPRSRACRHLPRESRASRSDRRRSTWWRNRNARGGRLVTHSDRSRYRTSEAGRLYVRRRSGPGPCR